MLFTRRTDSTPSTPDTNEWPSVRQWPHKLDPARIVRASAMYIDGVGWSVRVDVHGGLVLDLDEVHKTEQAAKDRALQFA